MVMGGDQMKAIRESKGLDQAGFAIWLNGNLGRAYDNARISKWENGAERIPRSVSEFLADDAGTNAIRRSAPNGRPATVIAFANQKGGVGKTSSAVNTAYLLSRLGGPTLLIDCDSQANASLHVGMTGCEIIELDEAGRTLHAALCQGVPLSSLIRETGIPGIDIVPAGDTLADADVELAMEVGGQTALRERIEAVRHDYAFIVIDSPPNLGLLTVNALAAVDLVAIPVQTELFAAHGLQRLVRTVGKIRRKLNPQVEILGIVPTMYNSRLTQDRATLEDLHRKWSSSTRVFDPIPRATAYSQSAAAGMITLAGSPNTPGASVYAAIAQAILDHAKVREFGNVA